MVAVGGVGREGKLASSRRENGDWIWKRMS